MAKLIIYHGTPQAREFELKPGSNYLGRGDANHCQITDPSVSTNHADIVVEGGTVRIKDVGSTNGTFLGQSQITEAILQPGQSLRLGSVNVLFQADGPALSTATQKVNLAPLSAPAPIAPPPVPVAPPPVPVVAAPPPIPVSAGGGLKISGLHHAEPEPAAPVTSLAPAEPVGTETALFEPPPGKTNCKFHPKISGQWLCRKCNDLFCQLCVVNRPSPEGTLHTCRKCGTVCVPVKVTLTQTKEKAAVVYSESMLMMRSLGFGFGAALLGALIWSGLSWLFGFDIPFLFGPMVGCLCGYAVKLGSQDTPGPVFSGIAVCYCILGCVLGKVGMIVVTHLTLNTGTTYMTGGLGLGLALYAAWKIGGSD